jgi:vacuolar-type H+-ATPase subunit E/Vma4
MDLHGDLEALLTEVHRRAEQRALERESEADARAREVVSQARDLAEADARTRLEEARGEARELHRRLSAQHELERQRAALSAREERIEAVWAAAEARLRELVQEPGAYRPVLERLAQMAADTLVAPADRAEDPAGAAPGSEAPPDIPRGTRPGTAAPGPEVPRPTLTLATDAAGAALLDTATLERLARRGTARFVLDAQLLPGWGGLEAGAGRLRADLRFDTRLGQARTSLRERVWQALQDGRDR